MVFKKFALVTLYMMKKRILLVAFLLISGVSNAQPKPEQEVIQLSRKKFDWMINKKYDSIVAVLDDRVQYVHSNGWVQNKKEIIEDIQSGKLIYLNIQIKEVAVRLFPQTAILNGLGTFQVMMDDKPVSVELRYTEVYVKYGSRWLLASRHANRMP